MQCALDLLEDGERCQIIVGKIRHEAVWSIERRCWLAYDLRGPRIFRPEEVDEWIPATRKC